LENLIVKSSPLCAVVLLPILACGCGSGGTSAVTGKVTLDGAPLEGATVQFQPDQGKRPSSGVTDAQGQYSLMYLPNQPGAELGKHTVRITAQRSIEKDGKEITIPEPVPGKYNTQTTLSAEVKGGNNTFNFDLVSDKDKDKAKASKGGKGAK
jgi:hypothetical protein